MKTFSYLLVLILSASITMTSCKKDSNEESNGFKFDGSTINIDKGYIEDFGINAEGSYDFDINLVTQGISVDSQGELVGTGDIIYLDLNSSISTGLAEGTYVWNENRENFSIVFGVVTFNFTGTMDPDQVVLFSNGSVDVSFDGDQVVLDLDLTTTDNKPLTGTFKGILEKI